MSNGQATGSTSGWSRRGALRSGAALAAAIGLAAEPAITGARSQSDAATPGAAPTLPPDFKVVLHAAEEQNWQYVLSNLKNLTADWPQAHLRVVVDGTAVYNLQGDNNITTELATLYEAGVELQVCPDALREHQIDRASIPAYARVDLGGVAALVLAQHEGYAYVKP